MHISKNNRAILVRVYILFFFALSSVSADQVTGQLIAFACSGCHGTDGQFENPGFPKLKSRPSEELELALLDFKYDRKKSSIMGRISKGYTDAELRSVALYFSRL